MPEPFDSCWRRVERAAAHRKALIEIWNAFIEEHPYSFSLNDKGEGEFILEVSQESPTPPELAVLTGEWLYNLRCALDYAIWAAAVYQSGRMPPPNEGQIQYLIYGAAADWERNLYRLKPLAQHQRDMLKQMQPYNSPDPDANYLGWLNRLARIDRHRRLSVVTAYMAEMSPVIGIPEGCSATLQFRDRVLIDGKAEIARVIVKPWREGWEIQANPRVGIDPEIEDWAKSPFWKRIPYNERFKMMQIFVTAEVAIYEYDSIGDTRKADLLTESFKVESDARRGAVQVVRHPQPRPDWGAPASGSPSTARPPERPGPSSPLRR